MSRTYRFLSIIIVVALTIGVIFSGVPETQAQGNTTPTPTAPPATSDNDDSDELPILLDISGRVQVITVTSIQVDNLTIIIPAGKPIPPEIKVGTIITIRANLRNNDTLSLITIVLGQIAPTPTPTEEPEEEETEEPTTQPTAPATLPATPLAVTPTAPFTPIPGCNQPNQRLGVLVATTYGVTYNEVINWRCRGFTFGVIARGFLVVFSTSDTQNVTIAVVLDARRRGKRWSVIIIEFGADPEPAAVIIVVTSGRVVVVRDCKRLEIKAKGKLKWKDCQKKPKKAKGKGKGKGKGK
jgi:hypothetical protein